ncbi:MAG: M24 family metallopeptidase [Armatimonadia bacterium]|nr:M24 family metallopeptidase [Armatimonadia bacterium]
MTEASPLSRPLSRTFPRVHTMRERADLTYRILSERLDLILPLAMGDADLDMWIILCQEDDLDPIHRTMIPLDCWCPILQMLVFVRTPEGVRRVNISGTDTKDLYERPYRGQLEEEQWKALAALVTETDPGRIGVNIGAVQWCGGGLTHNLLTQLRERLPEPYAERLVSAEVAATRWGSTLSPFQIEVYEHVIGVAHHLLADCYSREAVTPGLTTTEDLQWYYWQRAADLGLEVSFQPYFHRWRSEAAIEAYGKDDKPLRPGDMIHSDVGIKYLGLNSDHQQWAYLLRPGEREAPEGLRRLLSKANHLQDVFMDEFAGGRTGNEMLASILERARSEGVPNPKVYSHSLGMFLHEPGPLIGLPWEQERCEGRGDVALVEGNAFTAELGVRDVVPEWDGQEVGFGVEEDVIFLHGQCRMLHGRQERFYLI